MVDWDDPEDILEKEKFGLDLLWFILIFSNDTVVSWTRLSSSKINPPVSFGLCFDDRPFLYSKENQRFP